MLADDGYKRAFSLDLLRSILSGQQTGRNGCLALLVGGPLSLVIMMANELL